MKIVAPLTLIGTIVLLAGCVIAPVPLRETEVEDRWSGQTPAGDNIVIRAEVKTWYLPIVASPEGAAKMRSKKAQRTFYVVDAAYTWQKNNWPKSQRLPWLDLETSFTDSWQMIIRPEGSAYWIAFRVLDFEDEVERNENGFPKQRTYEIAVFTLKALISRRTVTTLLWPSPYDTEEMYLGMWQYDEQTNSLTYRSPDGWRRYRLLENREEPCQAPESMSFGGHRGPA